ncbi:MAG TPA: glycine cleavage system protein GcvH [bacterium]|nr:glycine cleavage system protein GcvH [Candidatus Omnitrophota bacterium]HOJ58683.1 glycine cleavage system protein GcvH [bacterium]HOL93628.1 glycine cleavage system protein GcvH [bacterium]HPP00099.1 glycine cleavage system protein GcvH [bacterium]HXK94004.1 glycine cleavage system protein GcvH [bacterium]
MIPNDLRYTETHEWVRVEGKVGVIGITHHAQEQLSDIVFVELPDLGKELTQGGECAVIESCKTAADLYAPVSGEVTEVNDDLQDHPEYINQDPYGKGWILKILMSDHSELDGLLSAEEYRLHIEQEG